MPEMIPDTPLIRAWKTYVLERRLFSLYVHTHRESGRKYVGQTCQTVEDRWRGHIDNARHGKGQKFGQAIRQFGPDAFHTEILEVVLGKTAANLSEKKWIDKLNCLFPHGFNLTRGGTGIAYLTPEQRHEIALAREAAKSPEQRSEAAKKSNESRTEEQKKQISEKISKLAVSRLAAKTQEERSTTAYKANASRTQDQRNGVGHKSAARLTPEQRSDRSRKSATSQTHQQMSDTSKKRWDNRTAEEKSEIGRKRRAHGKKADKLSPFDCMNLRQLVSIGFSVSELARCLRLPCSTVNWYLHRFEITNARPNPAARLMTPMAMGTPHPERASPTVERVEGAEGVCPNPTGKLVLPGSDGGA
jgi:group I intron endonuclease